MDFAASPEILRISVAERNNGLSRKEREIQGRSISGLLIQRSRHFVDSVIFNNLRGAASVFYYRRDIICHIVIFKCRISFWM